jgi:hypothetical protein
MRLAIALVIASLITGTAHAQDLDLRGSGLPRNVVTHIGSVLGDTATKRFTGTAHIAAGDIIESAVVITNGVLTVAGTIRGELIALQADVVFEPGGAVEGDITVAGGAIRNEAAARLAGAVTVYSVGVERRERAPRSADAPPWRRDRAQWRFGDRGGADLRIQVAENYNRVEGLPVQIGPEVWTSGSNPLGLQALAVWRSGVGPITDTRHMGYVARAEQFFGGGPVRVGASVRSTVDPIESWSITNLEASLAAALFHEDQRDYFERTGWSAYVRVAPRHTPLDATIELRDEEHRSLAPRDPWTLFNDDRAWRAQPLIGEGNIRTLRAAIEWADRRGYDFNTHGWLARAEVTRAIDGSLRVPLAPLAGGTTGVAEPIDFATDFTTGLIDVRRYEPAGPGGILGLRVVAGGALTDRGLPPQYQHALGGAGTLPGYALFSADCGARSTLVMRADDSGTATPAFFPAYGCDRFALVQLEYRGDFGFRFGHSHHDHDHGWFINWDFDWTFFFDAGRGWALERDQLVGRADTPPLYDVGAGVILGGLGIYGAIPLGDRQRGLRVFARLGPRF